MTELYALDVTPLREAALFARLLDQVPRERREKVLRLRREEDRLLSLGAGWLLSEVLWRRFGVRNPPLAITHTGKPVVRGRPEIQFSLSHTGRWAVCAADSRPVGVDAETVRPGTLSIARRFFTREELAALSALPPEKQDGAFARVWTRKEAYLKYTGEGLGRPLASFSPAAPARAGSPVYDPVLACWLAAYTLPDGTPLALCAAHPEMPPAVRLMACVPPAEDFA